MLRAAFVVVLCLAGAACSSSDDPATPDTGPGTPEGGAPPADRGPAADAPAPDQGPATGPLTVIVYDGDLLVRNSPAPAKTPLAGVAVAADLPGGERVELTTGADGKAVFADVRWADGTALVTAYLKGRVPLTRGGITAAYAEQEIWLYEREPGFATVTVHATGLADNVGWLWGGPTIPGRWSSYGYPPSFTIEVAPNEPFSVVAAAIEKTTAPENPRELVHPIAGWAKATHPGADLAGTDLTMDFVADKLTPTPFSATLVPPSNPSSPFRGGSAVVVVNAHDSNDATLLGRSTAVKVGADGAELGVTGEHVTLDEIAEPVTSYFLWLSNQHVSMVNVPGYPQDGATIDNFIDEAQLLSPADTTIPHWFEDPIEWSGADASLYPGVVLLRDGVALWALQLMPGTTRVTLPALPSTADYAEVFGSGPQANDPLDAQIHLCEMDPVRLDCTRLARGRTFRLAVPEPRCSADDWCWEWPLGRRPAALPTVALLAGVWGSAPADVFAVGANGAILHWDGAAWSKMTAPTAQHLNKVWGSGPSDVFAVGAEGAIAHYDGSSWTAMSSGTQEALVNVWGSGPQDVFAVGTAGTVLHYDGSAWSALDAGTAEPLGGVWGSAATDVLVAGNAGTLLRYDGQTWTPVDSGTQVFIRDLWGTAGDDVFAVGESFPPTDAVSHYDGNAWTTVHTLDWGLRAIAGSGPQDVFAVGQQHIVRYDGSAWSAMDPGPGITTLMDVWVHSDVVLAVAATGQVLRLARK